MSETQAPQETTKPNISSEQFAPPPSHWGEAFKSIPENKQETVSVEPQNRAESQENVKPKKDFLFSGSEVKFRGSDGNIRSGIVAGYDNMTGEPTITTIGSDGNVETHNMEREDFFSLNIDTPNRTFQNEETKKLKEKEKVKAGSFVEIEGFEGENWMISGYNENTGSAILVKRVKNEKGYFDGKLESKILEPKDYTKLKTVNPYSNEPIHESQPATQTVNQ